MHFVALQYTNLSSIASCTIHAYHKFNPLDRITLWTDNLALEVPTFVQKRNLSLGILDDTPLQAVPNLIAEERCDPCYSTQNLANAARLAIVYKYGGVYMDLDIVSIAPLPRHTRAVSAYKQSKGSPTSPLLNNCFLAFAPRDPCVFQMMSSFVKHFRNGIWGRQGPHLVTRTIEAKECRTVRVYEQNVLAPILPNWRRPRHAKGLFQHLTKSDIARLVKKGTVAVHVYSKVTGGDPGESPALCPKLASAERQEKRNVTF
jgi:hypothetical protein